MRDSGPTTEQPGAQSGKPDICVLVNPGSGKRADPHGELEAIFARHPGRFEMRRLGQGHDFTAVTEQAISDGFATIVAAGGDGTISGVAPLVARAGRRLGVLPLGTFNYFARALDLPEDIEGAVEVLLADHEMELSVGEVNGVGFLNNASLGAYAAILMRRERIYSRWGRSRLAAHWSVFTTLARFRSPLTVKVTVDGELSRMRSPLVFVANNAYQLERFGLDGAECVRDGKFALFIAPDCKRMELVAFALRLAWRSAKPGRDFELICGRDILVETRQKRRLVAHDGERDRMTGPFHFRIRDEKLRVAVPEATAEAQAEIPQAAADTA
jgi:diacylglycerol kinase family enzyme